MISPEYVKFVSDINRIFAIYEREETKFSKDLDDITHDDHEGRAEIDYLFYDNYKDLVGSLMTYLDSTLVDARFKTSFSD